MTQYASGAISPLGALIMKRLLLALAALFALFVVPAFADVCEFRFNPAGDSDLMPATIPI